MLLNSKHNEASFRQICRAYKLLMCLHLKIWQFLFRQQRRQQRQQTDKLITLPLAHAHRVTMQSKPVLRYTYTHVHVHVFHWLVWYGSRNIKTIVVEPCRCTTGKHLTESLIHPKLEQIIAEWQSIKFIRYRYYVMAGLRVSLLFVCLTTNGSY